jgi:hypothetical protein
MLVTCILKDEWKEFSESAHLSVFKERIDPMQERIDFALLVADDANKLILYCSYRETDKDSVYMQFGGSFPTHRGDIKVLPAFLEMVKWCKARYKAIMFHTENTNHAMIKLGMKSGFNIVGMSHGRTGKILLEHELRWT